MTEVRCPPGPGCRLRGSGTAPDARRRTAAAPPRRRALPELLAGREGLEMR